MNSKSKHQESEEVVIDREMNTRTKDTLSPHSPITFTEEQVAALHAQIQAFQLIQQGVPIPEHIQAALLPCNNTIANLEEAHLVLAEPAVGEESCRHRIAENIMFGQTSITDHDAFNIALCKKDNCYGTAENFMLGQFTLLDTCTFNVALDMDMLKDVIASTTVKSMAGVFGECRHEGPTPMPRRVESEIGEAHISSSGGNTLHTSMTGDPTTIPPPCLSFPAAVNSAVTVEMATFENPSSSDPPPPPEKESKYTAPSKKDPRLDNTIWRLKCISQNKNIDLFFRGRITCMLAFLRLYVVDEKLTWVEASLLATSMVAGRGEHLARLLRMWSRRHLSDHTYLPVNLYGHWKKSIIADEDFRGEIQAYLQGLGKEFLGAQDVRDYLNLPEIMIHLNRKKEISVRTSSFRRGG
ncbi:hypothetical protein ACEPAG_4790 [Sanghuangporus baumii]